MNTDLTDDQRQIVDAIERICGDFDETYWLECDREARFPHDFAAAMATDGWLGIAMPEAYGGAGLGVTEAALMMHTIAASGAAMAGCSSVHMNIFGPNPIVVFGTEEQKQRFLPPLIAGDERACFAVTEPDAGLDTTRVITRAVRDGNGYRIDGQKVWTSTAQVADKVLLLARTRPIDECDKPADGLSLFYTDLDRSAVEVRKIDKMGRHAVDSNALFIDGLKVPLEDRIGDEGQGFRCLLHGLNPERVLVAAEAIGIGRAALARATQYAKDRVVFGRPIGKNQAIQHPLAAHQVIGAVGMQQAYRAVEQRHLDLLAAPGHSPLVHGHQNREAGIEPGRQVGDWHADAKWRAVGGAVDADQAAHHLGDRIETGHPRHRPVRAIAGDLSIDQAREARRQHGVPIEAPFGHFPGLEVLDQDVGVVQQAIQHRLARVRRKIEPEAFLVAIDPGEIGTLSVTKRRPPGPRIVAPRRLDLDHLGAVITEYLGTERAGQDARQIDHLEPRQCAVFMPVRIRHGYLLPAGESRRHTSDLDRFRTAPSRPLTAGPGSLYSRLPEFRGCIGNPRRWSASCTQ